MKGKGFILAIAMIFLVCTSVNVATALNLYQEELSAIDTLTFTDEVEVTDFTLDGAGTIEITVNPKTEVVADKDYSATLYLDGGKRAISGFSFSDIEITNDEQKVVAFPGVDLSDVTTVRVELN